MKVFLEGNGFQVVGMGGLNTIVNAEINRITRQQAYHIVRDTFKKYRGEGLFAGGCPPAEPFILYTIMDRKDYATAEQGEAAISVEDIPPSSGESPPPGEGPRDEAGPDDSEQRP